MSMPVSNVDPTLRTITPDGLPLAILVLSTIFLGLSIITVSLRTYIRVVKGAFGLDDGFMCAGCVSLSIQHPLKSAYTDWIIRLYTPLQQDSPYTTSTSALVA